MGLAQAPLYAAWFLTYGLIFAAVAALITLVASFNLFAKTASSGIACTST